MTSDDKHSETNHVVPNARDVRLIHCMNHHQLAAWNHLESDTKGQEHLLAVYHTCCKPTWNRERPRRLTIVTILPNCTEPSRLHNRNTTERHLASSTRIRSRGVCHLGSLQFINFRSFEISVCNVLGDSEGS